MKKHHQGFTLIEMLIAIAIFSSLIAVLLMSFHQGLSLWEKGHKKAARWISLEHRYDWLEHVFSQANAAGYHVAGKHMRPFFHGDKKEMTLITAAPIMDTPGSLKPVQFRWIERDGRYALMYREGRQGADVHMDSFDFSDWIPLLHGVEKAYFRYEAPINPFPVDLPRDSLPEDMRKRYRDAPEWMSVFDSEAIVSLPSRVVFFFIDKAGDEHRWSFHCRYKQDVWPEEFYDKANQ